jgi:DNA primase
MAALVARRVKLSRSGRQMKGCCPFHGEKTPSFYVYEDGYHCFGCGAHGDAISFVMQTQGSSFPEAVAALAGEAGLELPKGDPGEAAAARERLDLHGVLAAAAEYYRQRLSAPGGATALAYLRGRGLDEATIERFGLGWAGEGRGALAAALAGAGITQPQLLAAGLLRTGDDGAVLGELFFNRVMFPIRDRGGRMISFGGRILGPGQPKYVNGPETALFSKRRTLFGLDLARPASRKGADLVAVEGYMDVIALHQAGFGAAVAPLGTALTGEQLEELWRVSPAPILCFDGDAAGGRAAARAALAALPLLAPDRTLRIATLPEGEDPDSLVARRGAAAFADVLAAARPLDEALFALLRGAGGQRTPEQRAELRHRLEAAAASIPDRALAAEYRRSLLDRFFAASRRGAAAPALRPARPVPEAAAARLSRCRKLTAILLHHPDLAHDLEEAYAALDMPPPARQLRDALLGYMAQAGVGEGQTQGAQTQELTALDSAGLVNHLHAFGFAGELALTLDETPSCGRPAAQAAEAAAGWWHFYGLMHRGGLEEAVEAARRQFVEKPDDPACLARLDALCQALFRLRAGEQAEQSDGGADAADGWDAGLPGI